MVIVLQSEGPESNDLLEAFVQIREVASCNDMYSGVVTDNMICAGHSSGHVGPCHVRGLQYY